MHKLLSASPAPALNPHLLQLDPMGLVLPASLTPEGAVADQEGSATTSTFVHAHSPTVKLTLASISANHHVMLVDVNPIRQVVPYPVSDTYSIRIHSRYEVDMYP
jgi:hypothetical protein